MNSATFILTFTLGHSQILLPESGASHWQPSGAIARAGLVDTLGVLGSPAGMAVDAKAPQKKSISSSSHADAAGHTYAPVGMTACDDALEHSVYESEKQAACQLVLEKSTHDWWMTAVVSDSAILRANHCAGGDDTRHARA